MNTHQLKPIPCKAIVSIQHTWEEKGNKKHSVEFSQAVYAKLQIDLPSVLSQGSMRGSSRCRSGKRWFSKNDSGPTILFFYVIFCGWGMVEGRGVAPRCL